MRRIVGIALTLLSLILFALIITDWIGADFAWFIDAATFLPFILMMASLIFLTGEFKIFVKAENAMLSKAYVLSAADKERAIELYKLLSKAVICTAVILTMMGVIAMLGQLESPDALGPMLSISLLSLLYGAAINLIAIYPAIHILKNRPDPEPVSIVISEKQIIDKLLELCYKQGISPEDIIAANEISFKKDDSQ
ncbi:MAG: hypothetical protein FWB91_08135 [Defluviitaleaceae bacterium]|nr:hypothetical protein [Defluviitaleaceae bacterium]